MSRLSVLILAVSVFVWSHFLSGMPLIPLAFAFAVVLWRNSKVNIWQAVIESAVAGWAMAKFASGFFSEVASSFGPVIHDLCCAAYSLNWVLFAFVLRRTFSWNVWQGALLAASTFVISERISGHIFGVTWIVTNVQLALSTTPIAQWSGILTPAGTSLLAIYFGCLLVPNFESATLLKGVLQLRPVIALIGLTIMWVGGHVIERSIVVEPLPFSAVIVQPIVPFSANELCGSEALAMSIDTLRYCSTDLVIWPEHALSSQRVEALIAMEHMSNFDSDSVVTRAKRDLIKSFDTNLLAGIPIVQDIQGYHEVNCGCLLTASDKSDCHEKQELMPIREFIPIWLNPLIQLGLFPILRSGSQFDFGRNYHSLCFDSQSGRRCTIAVAVCYESWCPWLPQYQDSTGVDAICHIASGSDFVREPELTRRMLNAIRLRAIETRRWQLVCSQFRGSAIVDPRGRISKQLGLESAVLRTDLICDELQSHVSK